MYKRHRNVSPHIPIPARAPVQEEEEEEEEEKEEEVEAHPVEKLAVPAAQDPRVFPHYHRRGHPHM
jgi:hypothetical protein